MNWRALHDYQLMLGDRVRMDAFETAIAEVCPDRLVCEIGVGLGPLSLMALKAGAVKVYGIEVDATALEIAVKVMKAHGFDESRFVPVHGLSSQVSLSEKVDVVLSETLDSMGLGENTAFYMRDAHRRFLHPGGNFLPRELTCWVALASPAGFRRREHFWSDTMKKRYGMDFSPVLHSLRSCKQTFPISAHEVHSDWCPWQKIDFSDPSTYRKTSGALLKTHRPELSLGVACVFEAVLSPGVTISTFPEEPMSHWQQGFAAFPRPIPMQAGDAVYLELDLADGDHPSLQFEMRVYSGEADRLEDFLRRQNAA